MLIFKSEFKNLNIDHVLKHASIPCVCVCVCKSPDQFLLLKSIFMYSTLQLLNSSDTLLKINTPEKYSKTNIYLYCPCHPTIGNCRHTVERMFCQNECDSLKLFMSHVWRQRGLFDSYSRLVSPKSLYDLVSQHWGTGKHLRAETKTWIFSNLFSRSGKGGKYFCLHKKATRGTSDDLMLSYIKSELHMLRYSICGKKRNNLLKVF